MNESAPASLQIFQDYVNPVKGLILPALLASFGCKRDCKVWEKAQFGTTSRPWRPWPKDFRQGEEVGDSRHWHDALDWFDARADDETRRTRSPTALLSWRYND